MGMADLNWGETGLLPVVVQDAASGEVLMLAYADREALERTRRDGRAWFYSRSRRAYWLKGETSGNFLDVGEVRYDCDADALLYRVKPAGPACHTGERSCFYREIRDGGAGEPGAAGDPGTAGDPGAAVTAPDILRELYALVLDRMRNRPEGSYVARLLAEGRDCILQKVGEEAVEVVLAGKNADDGRLVSELADLLFHLTVLLGERGVAWDGVWRELASRRRR